ncbi:hypothetical protein ACRYWZ_18190 (plasmid) [Agrobacterium deltaense]
MLTTADGYEWLVPTPKPGCGLVAMNVLIDAEKRLSSLSQKDEQFTS